MKRYAVECSRGRYRAVLATYDTRDEALEHVRRIDPYRVSRLRVLDRMRKPARIKPAEKPETYMRLSEDAKALGEKNDCGVKALAVLGNIPYAKAHLMLKARGRMARKGVYTGWVTNALKTLGMTLRAVDLRALVASYPGVHRNLRNVTTHHPRRFPAAWDKSKRYLCETNGHLLAISGGQVQDYSINKALRIRRMWEVM